MIKKMICIFSLCVSFELCSSQQLTVAGSNTDSNSFLSCAESLGVATVAAGVNVLLQNGPEYALGPTVAASLSAGAAVMLHETGHDVLAACFSVTSLVCTYTSFVVSRRNNNEQNNVIALVEQLV